MEEAMTYEARNEGSCGQYDLRNEIADAEGL